jgi:hypothetical protein
VRAFQELIIIYLGFNLLQVLQDGDITYVPVV